jgi:dTMP kinase
MSFSTGRFLTLEGVDGAGKSTHVQWLVDHLRGRGLTVVSTREPGGCPLAETLRDILLHTPMQLETETLLMFAARSEHLALTVRPALARGDWVVCDRFTDATFAYQGGGRELGAPRVAELERWVHPDFKPDLTWLFDVPLEVAAQRLAGARSPDRFEQESGAFFERTRAGYHARARADAARFRILDGTQSIEALRVQLSEDIDRLLGEHG